MKARYGLLLAAVAGTAALVLATAAVRSAGGTGAGETITGTWTAEPAAWKATLAQGPRVQLSLSRRRGTHGSSQHSNPVALAELRGLTADQMSADASSVSFTLERDAGRFAFDGTFRRSEGAGHFTFAPRPEFVAAMRGLGYAVDEEKLYSMAVLDVSRDFVRQLDALGYARLELDDLLSLRIHGADPAFIREVKGLGYDHLPVEDLVSFRIHGATPDFIRQMQSLGYRRLSADDLVSLRIHGATPEFVRKMQSLGLSRLSAEDLVSLRIHGASPDFVRQLRELGYERVSAEDLVSMRIHGVSPEFIKELKSLGYDHVAVEELVSMRIHGVSPEFVRRVQASRGAVSIERLVDMRIHGQER
jgi:hypothetical protein